MQAARILVVEDEHSLASIMEAYLRREGFHTERASSGKEALQLAHTWKPDLILLDIMLPELDGLEVLKRLQTAQQDVRVILLTARSEQLDKLLGLKLGADDYVVKPFDPNEVVLRVHAVLRRSQPQPTPALRLGQLELDLQAMNVQVSGTRVHLTLTEYRLLEVLARHPQRTFSREELLERCWEGDALGRTVDVHMGTLRRKLEQHGIVGMLETVRGVGYRLWIQ
ncbi:response regulator transcription factor [Deinococcus roseus]|nr:response regulator transcription factor [Deinococcus roseus]